LILESRRIWDKLSATGYANNRPGNSRMSSSGTLKTIGIFAAIVTGVTGTVASNFASQGAVYKFATTITTIAFFVWVLSALVLLVRLCRWLYATRASRTGGRGLWNICWNYQRASPAELLMCFGEQRCKESRIRLRKSDSFSCKSSELKCRLSWGNGPTFSFRTSLRQKWTQ
jgi:hypothetical protein